MYVHVYDSLYRLNKEASTTRTLGVCASLDTVKIWAHHRFSGPGRTIYSSHSIHAIGPVRTFGQGTQVVQQQPHSRLVRESGSRSVKYEKGKKGRKKQPT